MNNLFGLYRGIIVSNYGKTNEQDLPAGKVLVKIDGVTPSTFDEAYKALPSSNVQGTLDFVSCERFEVLATVMTPIFGESTQATYNATTDESQATQITTSSQFGIMNEKLRDKYGDGPKTYNNPLNNAYGHSFSNDHRHKAGKGVFAVPEKNARVIVMFLNGARAYPVVLGKCNTSDEVEGYYNAGGVRPGYPNVAQNYKQPSQEIQITNFLGTTKDDSYNPEADAFLNGPTSKDTVYLNSLGGLPNSNPGMVITGPGQYNVNSINDIKSSS